MCHGGTIFIEQNQNVTCCNSFQFCDSNFTTIIISYCNVTSPSPQHTRAHTQCPAQLECIHFVVIVFDQKINIYGSKCFAQHSMQMCPSPARAEHAYRFLALRMLHSWPVYSPTLSLADVQLGACRMETIHSLCSLLFHVNYIFIVAVRCGCLNQAICENVNVQCSPIIFLSFSGWRWLFSAF